MNFQRILLLLVVLLAAGLAGSLYMNCIKFCYKTPIFQGV